MLHLPFLFFLCHIIFAFNIDVDNAIIFKLPRDEERRSYFGMSVAIRPRAGELLEKDWIFQIGAPRRNISNLAVVEPGAVFRCRVNGLCYLHNLDQKGNVQIGKKFSSWNKRSNVWKKLFVERKDGGWVGVSMDVKRYREGEVTVICGHRLSYQALTQPYNIHDDQYLSIGGCYVDFIYEPNSTRLLLPLKNEDRAYYMVSESQADFDWGQGLAGMSSHLSNAGLLLGAPHVYYMSGTILKYPRDWKQPFVADISAVHRSDVRLDFFAYNGYSVGSGNFFGDGKEWYVFGAPRSDGLHGRVYAAQFQEHNGRRTIVIHHSIQRGETYGEYFGSSLDVGDVNKDGFDDLIVGAPMFSQRFTDQGRVYVFLGSKLGFQPNAILNGASEQARFGTCVSVVGDLDQDGYKDVIVGAPNQELGGALFIFSGNAQGISQQASQVIHASDINTDLIGFGISISRAIDVDRNKYPDILVGAYQSDEAVLLRSRQVIFLTPSIKHPTFLDRKQNQFVITVCFAYLATYPPKNISLDAVIIIDEEMGRARFGNNSSQVWNFNALNTWYDSPTCKNLNVLFDMTKLNGTFNVPVQVSLENSLHNEPVRRTSQIVWENQAIMHSLLPVTNDDISERKITVEVPFAGDCGLDKICHSHLKLQCDFDKTHVLTYDEKHTFLVGYSDLINVAVSITNLKEPAYYTNLAVIVDGFSAGDITPQDSSCTFQNAPLHCVLGTIDENANRELVFQISTKQWALSASPIVHLKFHVSTSSNETHPEDSSCELDLSLGSQADVHLLASASEATISLTDSSQAVLNFTHMYEAEKIGKSPVTVTLTVSIPTTFNSDMVFAALDKNNPQISVATEVNEEEVLKLSEKGNVLNTRGSFDDFSSSSLSFPVERTLFLNCSSKHVQCITYSFFVSSAPSTLGRDFPILFNISALEIMLDNIDVIHFTTNGTAMIEDRFGPKQFSSKETSTSIIMVPPPAEVEMRTIALAAVAGGLLLALIIPILIREGFFRRKTREQMEALKVLDFINERFSIYEPMDAPDRSSDISVATIEG